MIITDIVRNKKIEIFEPIGFGDVGKKIKVDGVVYRVVQVCSDTGVYVMPIFEHMKRYSIININGKHMSLSEAEQNGYDISKYLEDN